MRPTFSSRAMLIAALATIATLTRTASAQSTQVVPFLNATVAGDINNSIPIGASPGGTYQVLYPADMLATIPVGSTITSFQLRLRNAESSPWPAAPATITSYVVTMGGSTKTPSTLSTTFADNITNPQIVRSGPLDLAAGAYPAGAASGTTPEGWGPVIELSSPYIYNGGPLVVEFRNTGTATAVYGDAVTSAALGGAVASTVSNTALTGNPNFAIIIRLGYFTTQPVTLPNANDTVAGGSNNRIPFAGSTGGRHLSLYAADQLADLPPGSLITGLQLRQQNSESTPWPSSGFTCSDYEIWMSQSSLTPSTISTTFASNLLNAVQVRDGARLFSANEFPAGPASGTTPEGWGPIISLDTPYLYQGGVLGIEYRNGGGASPARFCDAVASSSTAAGLGATSSPTATTGVTTGAIIVRLLYVRPVESPFGEGITKIYALRQFADTSAGDFFAGFTQSSSFTTQYLFGLEQFQTIGPGTRLTAVAFRNAQTTSWPPALAAYPQFDIRLSRSPLTPATMSTTVASNSSNDAVTVRSGPLTIPANALVGRTSALPAAFSWEVPFSTPYVYRSDALDMRINNDALPVLSGGRLDALNGNTLAFQSDARGKFSAGVFNASTLPNAANVPVTRYSANAQVMVPNHLRKFSWFSQTYSTNSPFASTPTTIQYIIAASELTYIPIGGVINAASFLSSLSAWPGPTGAIATDYTIEVSSAVNPPQAASNVFAENTGPDAIIVRSGPVSWLPGALPAQALSGYAFGGTIQFNRGFVYKGGPLCVTIRHAGVSGPQPTLRAANPATLVRTLSNAGQDATTGDFFTTDAAGAIQLGYIPAGTTPKSRIKTPGTLSRNLFGVSRTFQMLYNAEAMGVPVGATINAVTWRLQPASDADFPTAEVSFSRFDLWMSSSPVTAATASSTIATNDGADLVQVRSGPLTIPAGSWPANSRTSREDWGLFIQFDKPFVYRGGTLAFTIRSSAPTGPASGFFETTNDAAPATDVQGVRNVSDPDATTGSFNKPPTAFFAFTDDAFCPADLNNDGVVEDLDFQVFALAYNVLDCKDPTMALGCSSDLNYDGVVDDLDFQVFANAYDALVCPE